MKRKFENLSVSIERFSKKKKNCHKRMKDYIDQFG